MVATVIEVSFRSAEWVEEPEIKQLVKDCGKFVRTYSGIRNLQQLFEKGSVYVAETTEERKVAFAVVAHLVRKPFSSIYEIGTHPEFQRHGIGRRFISYIQHVSPHNAIRLVCDARNEQGLNFYRSLGFTNLGARTNKSGDVIYDLEVTA
jgi:ribosomal protein S18 acetylase RimI-like enzyme